jgi:peptidoglycan/xylan/chitin deacetylase (PgdA/CDA1 family)
MICITFDNFGNAAEFGFGQGVLPPEYRHESVPPGEWAKYNELGLTLGHPRILGVLKETGVRTSFAAEGYSAVIHPVELKRWADDGHEIVLHGWKHETWHKIPDEKTEDRLLTLGMAAMRETLGDKAPVGFRPPSFGLSPWSENLLEKLGIQYVSDLDRTHLKRLKFSPCSKESPLIDALIVRQEDGGLLPDKDDQITAYDKAYEAAVAHETATPDKPWVFIAHPLVSGNRAWMGFDRFIRRLRGRFETNVFKTIGEVALAA